ncbi:MAG: reductive dehalogenase [Bacteroidales bacterium]|nr:reductive dehalogenase [Bacteroidales bacterium]
MPVNEWFLLITIGMLFLSLLYAAFVSFKENEFRAAKLFLFTLCDPLIAAAFIYFEYPYKTEIIWIILILYWALALLFLIPFGKKKSFENRIPKTRIDERDIMFSRAELVEGSPHFEAYYKRRPENKAKDDEFRSRPGLLSSKALFAHSFAFAAAEASFETIGALKNEVEGMPSASPSKGNAKEVTKYIKNWSKKLGATDCGITVLKDYHLYSVGGRGARYDKIYEKKHDFAIAFTVEMDHRMMQSAPKGSAIMESAQQYLESGRIAVQVAHFIRKMGYDARAHIDGNYEVVCPLVARDAGLGEIGRMGLLMTPKQGPRVRIAVVTTNMPLIADTAKQDAALIDFCVKCRKCADACPSQAISFADQKDIDGAKRWQINQEACYTYWTIIGTDCGRCVSVCPFSHPNNPMHNLVRSGIKNSALFRSLALELDDLFYKRKPDSKPLPEWMNVNVEH